MQIRGLGARNGSAHSVMQTVICVVLSALLGPGASLGPRVSAARDNTLDRSGATWCAHVELRIARTSLPLSRF